MSTPPIPFGGNTSTSVVRQGKYRISHADGGFHISVIIETDDGIRSYPSTNKHPDLVAMVNAVKTTVGGAEAGQFYINEWEQVIVPAGTVSVGYFFAGEYHNPIILGLEGEEFSGRPHDDEGNLLKPGDPWLGRPRPGMRYVLKAGGADIEYFVHLSPGRERRVLLSNIIGPTKARLTARKIAAIRGNQGGSFYINEYRAIFGPTQTEDGYAYIFIGVLTDGDAWFPKWCSEIEKVPTDLAGTDPRPVLTVQPGAKEAATQQFIPTERRLEICDGDMGNSFENLFAAHFAGARHIIIEDPFMSRPHQVANLLRLCELLVKLASVKEVTLITRELSDESTGRIESLKRSLVGHGIHLQTEVSSTLHDRRIKTDHGWEINLGRGLDMYKRPDDWASIGVSDFALRPCHQTTIIFHRLGAEPKSVRQSA